MQVGLLQRNTKEIKDFAHTDQLNFPKGINPEKNNTNYNRLSHLFSSHPFQHFKQILTIEINGIDFLLQYML
jgi:hypothetical protein